ncbi:MAG: tRNA (N(6)-L-threonylcarbamoyladenosine(37)-C(2))-methylthiotransferase MtaB [Brevinema sp.]
MSKKFHLINLGCKLNAFEGEALMERLMAKGHTRTELDESDIVVVNTCTVTAKADEKGKKIMRKAKSLGKKVIATGCYATTDGLQLAEENYIDLILRNEQKFDIEQYLPLLDLGNKIVEGTSESFPEVSGFERTRAFLKVQDGCNKFCSFCKIPFARGRSKSQDFDKIHHAFKVLLDANYKEIVLTGINLTDFSYEGGRLGSLVESLLDYPHDYRLRLSSLQPDDFDPALLEALQHPKMSPHFHLSVQSGSDSVLKRMRRHYSQTDYLGLVDKIRKISPDAGITTDIIVGFPEETDTEFQETLAMVDKAGFVRVHIFPYSAREGTAAGLLPDFSSSLKKEREAQLLEVCTQSALRFARNECLGRTYRALTETDKKGVREAYTENYIRVHFPSSETEANQFITVTPNDVMADKDGHLVFLIDQ